MSNIFLLEPLYLIYQRLIGLDASLVPPFLYTRLWHCEQNCTPISMDVGGCRGKIRAYGESYWRFERLSMTPICPLPGEAGAVGARTREL
jgi:hypothetical protein